LNEQSYLIGGLMLLASVAQAQTWGTVQIGQTNDNVKTAQITKSTVVNPTPANFSKLGATIYLSTTSSVPVSPTVQKLDVNGNVLSTLSLAALTSGSGVVSLSIPAR
jgi:hypothetical protein